MRTLVGLMVVVVVSGCATPRMTVEAVLAKAAGNEVAAARSTHGVDVLVVGTIQDITFLVETQLETVGTAGRNQSHSVTSKQRQRAPYVSLLTEDGAAVFCFPKEEDVPSFDRLVRGEKATFVGTFHSFSRGESSGALRVTLGSCRIAE
jgi:hypothetical protein